MIFKKYYLINLAYTSLTMTKVDFNSFIEIWLTCNKLHIHKIHNLVCFNIYHMMSYDENITTSKTVNIPITLKVSFYPIAIYLPSLPPYSQPFICFLLLYITIHFLKFYMNVYLSLVWLLSLIRITLTCHHIIACINSSFPFIAQ